MLGMQAINDSSEGLSEALNLEMRPTAIMSSESKPKQVNDLDQVASNGNLSRCTTNPSEGFLVIFGSRDKFARITPWQLPKPPLRGDSCVPKHPSAEGLKGIGP